MAGDISMEFTKMLKATDECELHEMVRLWLVGDITPEALAAFFLELRDFKDLNRLVDVFDKVIYFAYLATPEASQAEQTWKDNLLAQKTGSA